MGTTCTIQHPPIPLRDWLHEHQQIVSFSLGMIVVILAVVIAAPTATTVRAAIAEHTEISAEGTRVISTTVLPREWSWSIKPISFDHMYRQSEPRVEIDYTRNLSSTYFSPRRSGR
ncbi:MAG: hypothetical protein JRE57_04735 [Deltaproteobacteria bacterium]|nr:hypothetical protein [Deltaproteobacteria bacterium]